MFSLPRSVPLGIARLAIGGALLLAAGVACSARGGSTAAVPIERVQEEAAESEAESPPPTTQTPADEPVAPSVKAAFDPTAPPAPAPALDPAKRAACVERHGEALHADAAPGSAESIDVAATCFWDAGAVGVAVRLWDLLCERFPESPQAPFAWMSSARAYDGLDRHSDAAERYERFAVRYPKHESAKDALSRAACLVWSLGDVTATERMSYHLRRLYRIELDPRATCGN